MVRELSMLCFRCDVAATPVIMNTVSTSHNTLYFYIENMQNQQILYYT